MQICSKLCCFAKKLCCSSKQGWHAKSTTLGFVACSQCRVLAEGAHVHAHSSSAFVDKVTMFQFRDRMYALQACLTTDKGKVALAESHSQAHGSLLEKWCCCVLFAQEKREIGAAVAIRKLGPGCQRNVYLSRYCWLKAPLAPRSFEPFTAALLSPIRTMCCRLKHQIVLEACLC